MTVSRLFRFLALSFVIAFGALPSPYARADGYVTKATLDNGLQVVIVRDPLAPVVTEITTYKAGFDVAPPEYPETPHAVEHMVAGRSLKNLSESQSANIWTLLGANADAETSWTSTQYYFTMPSGLLSVALHIEAERMSGALFLPSEWNDERPAIVNELQGYASDSSRRFLFKQFNALYPGVLFDEPYHLQQLQKTPAGVLKAFYERWYAPNNALLVITGDVDPAATLDEVRSIFSTIPKRAVPAASPAPQPPPNRAPLADVSDLPVPIGYYAWRMPGGRDRDAAVAQIASDVLSSERGPLAALGYEGKALGAGFEYEDLGTAGLGRGVIVAPPGAKLNDYLALLASTMETTIKNGVPADLVEAAKRREVASALYSRNSIEGLAGDWTSAIVDSNADSPDQVVARFSSVTTADVNAFLQSNLKLSEAVPGTLTPQAGAKGGNGGTGIKDTFAPKNAQPVALPSWARVLEEPAVIPPARKLPSDVTLANGIRLIVEQNSITPTVTLAGSIRQNAGLQTPAGQEGVDDVLGGLFPYGTTSLDRLAFQKALDDVAVDVSAGPSFSARAPKEQFDRAVDLLADNLLHPAMPASAFTTVRTQTAQALEGQRTSPAYLAGRAMATALYPKGDPALREATPESVSKLNLGGVRSFYTQTYRPDMTTIVIVGDITPEAARAVIERAFGSWKASGPRPDLDLTPLPPNKPADIRITAAGRTQDLVRMSETLAITRRSADFYPLQLGNQVLGGGFYSTRLYQDLRKNTGLVYYVNAGVDAGRYRATYDVGYESAPKNNAPARAILNRDLTRMRSEPVSPGELQTAKSTVIRGIPQSFASIGGIAETYLRYASLGLGLDEADHAMRTYNSVTAEQIQTAFRRWVDPARFVQVTTGPASP